MSSTRKQAQHASRIVRVTRLAQDLAIYRHNGVRTKDEVIWFLSRRHQGFFPRQTLGAGFWRFARLRNFWDVDGLRHEWNASVTEKFLAALRSRGKNEHGSLILADQLDAISERIEDVAAAGARNVAGFTHLDSGVAQALS